MLQVKSEMRSKSKEEPSNYHFSRPKLENLLGKLRLNKEYTRSEKNLMYYTNTNNDEVEVVDFIGGFGSLMLGHNNPELIQYSMDLLSKNIPIHSQMASKRFTGDLAKAISDEIGSHTNKEYISTFANSGAEAVEAAHKHCRMQFVEKLNRQRDAAHIELQRINNFYSKNEFPFFFQFEGKDFYELKSFNEFFLQRLESIIESADVRMLSAKNAYHGKTAIALELTYNEDYKTAFEVKENQSDVTFFQIDEADFEEKMEDLIVTLEYPSLSFSNEIELKSVEICSCIGVIIEPIQGEGGVVPVSGTFLKFLRDKTKASRIPLIFDEIQTGSFRTGFLLHSMRLGVEADVYLLGKSLGGGIVKNAALVVEKSMYNEDFGVLHTSTFADDEFTSAVSLKALKLMKERAHDVLEIEGMIERRFNWLKSSYSDVIKEVRGTGLMWGIEFKDMEFSANGPFQNLSRSGSLSYLIAAFLLNKKNIRVGITLSNKYTIRIQPSVEVNLAQIEQLTLALEELSVIIRNRDFYKLVEPILDEKDQHLRATKNFNLGDIPYEYDASLPTSGFLSHYIDNKQITDDIKSMEVLSEESLNDFLRRMLGESLTSLISSQIVTSDTGERVNLLMFGLPFTAKMYKEEKDPKVLTEYLKLCQNCIESMKDDFNCDVVGLGQYTSIITNNGQLIPFSDVDVTTGNSYTIGVGVDALLSELKSIQTESITLGIIGAGGNIMSTYVKCILPYSSNLLLKGSDSERGIMKVNRFANQLTIHVFNLIISDSENEKKMIHQELFDQLNATELIKDLKSDPKQLKKNDVYNRLLDELKEETPIKCTTDLMDFQSCNATIVATSNPEPFLFPECFSEGSVVYDISVPNNCTEELIHNTKGIKVLLGGIVRIPNDFKKPSRVFPLDDGEAYACLSETILIGLEREMGSFSYGNINTKQVHSVNAIAKKHGLKYLKPKQEKIF